MQFNKQKKKVVEASCCSFDISPYGENIIEPALLQPANLLLWFDCFCLNSNVVHALSCALASCTGTEIETTNIKATAAQDENHCQLNCYFHIHS
jgi:hypothetical protein